MRSVGPDAAHAALATPVPDDRFVDLHARWARHCPGVTVEYLGMARSPFALLEELPEARYLALLPPVS